MWLAVVIVGAALAEDAPLAIPAEEAPSAEEGAAAGALPAEESPPAMELRRAPPGVAFSPADGQRLVRERIEREVKPGYFRGMAPGDRLAVCAPFRARSGQVEYLWLEVDRWPGDDVEGRLLSSPRAMPMERGDRVRVREADLYDYSIKRADGRKEGGVMTKFSRAPI